MSGHTAGRPRRWPWAILSVLFALAFAWSFAVMGEHEGGVWSILRIGSAVGLVGSALGLVLTFISSRRLQSARDDAGLAEGDEGAVTGVEGQPLEEQPAAETSPRTYEEVFGVQPDLDAESLPGAPEGEEPPGDEGTELEPEGQPSAELPAEAPKADSGSQDDLQRIREEFRARAEEAALRAKQREDELHEAEPHEAEPHEAEPHEAEPHEAEPHEAELQETASVADQER